MLKYDCELKDELLGRGVSGRLEIIIEKMLFVEQLNDLYFIQHKKIYEIGDALSINAATVSNLLRVHFTKDQIDLEREYRKNKTIEKYKSHKAQKSRVIKGSETQITYPNSALKFQDLEIIRDMFFVKHLTYEQIAIARGTSKQNCHKIIHKYFPKNEIELEYEYRRSVTQTAIHAKKMQEVNKQMNEYRKGVELLYRSGFPMNTISELTGRSVDAICDMVNSLRGRGIELAKRNPNAGNYR
jgi:hypothetical protein